MTDTSKAKRAARRKQRRVLVRAGRREAFRMIAAGEWDAMPSFDPGVRRTEREWVR